MCEWTLNPFSKFYFKNCFRLSRRQCKNCDGSKHWSCKLQLRWNGDYVTVRKNRRDSHLDWKTWENEKAFSSQGKVKEFWTDWKIQSKFAQKTRNVGEFQTNVVYYFLVIFKWNVYYLLKWIRFFSWKKRNIKIFVSFQICKQSKEYQEQTQG